VVNRTLDDAQTVQHAEHHHLRAECAAADSQLRQQRRDCLAANEPHGATDIGQIGAVEQELH
jgi:hypothetical protein